MGASTDSSYSFILPAIRYAGDPQTLAVQKKEVSHVPTDRHCWDGGSARLSRQEIYSIEGDLP
jgi:hypothetical protein